MRHTIAIVLSAILVTTPTNVVLAQADQRESQVAATGSTRIQIPTRIGVPVVEPGSGAALLFGAGIRGHSPARDALPPRSRRVSTVHKVVRTAGLLMGLVRAVGVVARDYPRSTFSVRPLWPCRIRRDVTHPTGGCSHAAPT
jgi:hypothetical protein